MLRLDVLMKSHKLVVSCLALSPPLAVVGCSGSGSKTAAGSQSMATATAAADVLANSTNGEIFEEAEYQYATSGDANTFYTDLENKWPACGTVSVSDSSGDSGSFTVAPATCPQTPTRRPWRRS